MPLKSIYNINFGFIEQNHIFEHYKEIETRKNLLIDFIFVMKKNSDDLFRAAPYRLMLVLHKDAVLHYNLQGFSKNIFADLGSVKVAGVKVYT